MATEKKYCGSATEKKFNDGGSIIETSINLTKLVSSYIKKGNDGKDYICLTDLCKLTVKKELVGFFCNKANELHAKINISQKQAVGQYGDTHSVYLNEWVSTTQTNTQPNTQNTTKTQTTAPIAPLPVVEEDLPF